MTYIVTLNLQTGGYEKDTTILVEAPTPEIAVTTAIYVESHDEPEFNDERLQSANDLCGEFHYSARKVQEVDEESAKILSEWFPIFKSDNTFLYRKLPNYRR